MTTEGTRGDEDRGETALVIAARGHRLELETADGRAVPARARGKRLRVICGDRVIANAIPGEPDWLVTEILGRRNTLERVDGRGRNEALAANLDCLVVVCAPLPEPDFFIVDRYLCAAELMGAEAAIVFNKIDLADRLPAELHTYESLGYPVVRTIAEGAPHVEALAELLAGRTSLLAGQSGVGKSSLINALVPDASRRIGDVSTARGEGRHTTVAAEIIRLPGDGRLVDSPGVRDFAPYIAEESHVQAGYREILAASDECRFNDCRHVAEPDCAVRAAVAAGRITDRRYRSYRRLLNLTRQLRRD